MTAAPQHFEDILKSGPQSCFSAGCPQSLLRCFDRDLALTEASSHGVRPCGAAVLWGFSAAGPSDQKDAGYVLAWF